jgi:hypothetical protein
LRLKYGIPSHDTFSRVFRRCAELPTGHCRTGGCSRQ